MKTLYLLPILALLASCADTIPPRAIIAPETAISAVDTQETEKATVRVSDAAEKVSAANRKASEANGKAVSLATQLRAALDKLAENADAIRILAMVDMELISARASLAEAKKESDAMREAVKSLAAELSVLKASAAVNKAATESIRAENKTLRDQAQQGNQARDDLLALRAQSKEREKTLKGWIIKLGIAVAALAIATALLGYIILKP